MISRSRVDPGPSVAEMLFKAGGLAALTLLVSVHVFPVVGLLILEVVATDASMDDELGIVILAGLLAVVSTLGVVAWSVWRDVADRRRARSGGRLPVQRVAADDCAARPSRSAKGVRQGMRRDLPDLQGEIVPGQSAAGVLLGAEIAALGLHGRWETMGSGVHRLGPVTVWVREGVVDQVGVCAPYAGSVLRGAIRIGSTLEDAAAVLGPLAEDDVDNLVLVDLPGIAFGTTAWRGTAGSEVWTDNLDARITDIFVYRVDSAG